MKHDAFMLLQITVLHYYFHDATLRSTFSELFSLPAIEQLHHIFMEVPLSGLQLIDQRSERWTELTVVKNSFGV